MLCELIIENVAVIEKAVIDFRKGFTCLTGETGAGKSIIIDSINAIMGDRVSKNIVRTGAEKASVVAVFENLEQSIIDKAMEMDIDLRDECIVSRQITAEGKSTARINALLHLLLLSARHLVVQSGQLRRFRPLLQKCPVQVRQFQDLNRP